MRVGTSLKTSLDAESDEELDTSWMVRLHRVGFMHPPSLPEGRSGWGRGRGCMLYAPVTTDSLRGIFCAKGFNIHHAGKRTEERQYYYIKISVTVGMKSETHDGAHVCMISNPPVLCACVASHLGWSQGLCWPFRSRDVRHPTPRHPAAFALVRVTDTLLFFFFFFPPA